MNALAKEIAHVSFPGGGIFLPARSPYDRETLTEYIAHTVRVKGRVQVLVGDQRWLVQGTRDDALASCVGCGRSLDATCNFVADAGAADYCVRCAFAPEAESSLSNPPGPHCGPGRGLGETTCRRPAA